MKISLKWIERINTIYNCSANPAPDGPEALIERIGAQLGGVDEVEYLGKLYEGILVAKVISCEKHPNADKLSVCMLDVGKAKTVQVVCGAPNVAEGQLVAWIPPGAVVPATYHKDPFTLEAKELRSVVSNGMIASLSELAIGDDHSGILVIDQPAKPGQALAEVYALDDHIIDIENKMFTHRPDLFGMLGIAREIAGIQGHVFKSPKFYQENAVLPKLKGPGLKFDVENQLPKTVPRFTVVVIRDIKVGPSPVWLQSFLSRVGIRPINNIVDMTNFYMYGTAQPLHAYDYDKVGDKIIVRKPKAGESLKLLGGKTIKFMPADIVIASATEAIGLGGVMGGADTEVTNETTNIILECANFSSTAIRRSSMEHGLFTDAVTRFNKGQSPRQNLAVLDIVASTLMHPSIAGGRIASPIIDIRNFDAKPVVVNTTVDFINSRLGVRLTPLEIKKLLTNVEFKVTSSSDKIAVEAPFWRTDIEIPEDIVEEVGRLYGYDHLPIELPKRDTAATIQNRLFELKSRIRQILASAGADEVLNYSFVHGSLFEKVGQDPNRAYKIKNALSPDLQYYRLSLAPSLLEKVHPNIKLGFDKFVLFEIGQQFAKDKTGKDKLPLQMDRLAVVYANKKSSQTAYYTAKKYLTNLLVALGIQNVKFEAYGNSEHRTATYYEPERSADILVGGKKIGVIGEFRPSVSTALKLPDSCAGFELHIEDLLELIGPPAYQPLNRFPAVSQDVSLRVPAGTEYASVEEFLRAQLDTEAAKHGYNFHLEPLDIYQKDKTHKQITMRIILEHSERTLTTAETNKLLDIIADKAKTVIKGERI